MENKIDLNTTCRACLVTADEMHELFGNFDQGLSLAEILHRTTNFEVEESDGLSSYLCDSCTTVIVDFFNFKILYEENECYAKSLIKRENTQNDDHLLEAKEIEQPLHNESDQYSNVINAIDIYAEEVKVELCEAQDNPDENADILKSVKYNCPHCDACFLIKSAFEQHMLQKHNLSVSEFQNYVSSISLKNTTVKVNDEIITFQCNECGNEYKNFPEVESHLRTHTKISQFICDRCGASFKKKSYLIDHADVHSSLKLHVCPICKKAFKRRTVLVKHKRLHTQPRQCVCEMCGLRFNDKGILSTHIKLKHIRERNYPCHLCNLLFPLKSTLEKHIRRHDKSRKQEYACSFCSMEYKDKSSLNRHVSTKHKNYEKPVCNLCGKRFSSKANLFKHTRKHQQLEKLNGEYDNTNESY